MFIRKWKLIRFILYNIHTQLNNPFHLIFVIDFHPKTNDYHIRCNPQTKLIPRLLHHVPQNGLIGTLFHSVMPCHRKWSYYVRLPAGPVYCLSKPWQCASPFTNNSSQTCASYYLGGRLVEGIALISSWHPNNQFSMFFVPATKRKPMEPAIVVFSPGATDPAPFLIYLTTWVYHHRTMTSWATARASPSWSSSQFDMSYHHIAIIVTTEEAMWLHLSLQGFIFLPLLVAEGLSNNVWIILC